MAIHIPGLKIIVGYTYDEESGIGVWQVTSDRPQEGPCQHILILYSDGDAALAHTQSDGTTVEQIKDPDNPIDYGVTTTETKQ